MIMPADFFMGLTNSLTACAEWVAIASLKTIPFIALVLIVQRLFRKQLSAASRHLLWLSVLLSLSIPFGWTFNISKLPNPPLTENALTRTQTTDSFTVEKISAGSVATTTSPQNSLPTSYKHTRIETLGNYYTLGLVSIWLLGAMIFFGLTLAQVRYFYQLKIKAVPATQDIVSLFEACKYEMGIGKKIQLLSSGNLQSPITLGWLKPAVILPENIEQQLTPATLKHVLLHELGHIQRQDIFFNWLACLINIVHWFNPAVWFACKRMRMDMEMACDALVLSHLDKSQRTSYGATLIEISEIPRTTPKALTTLGILENHTELKERLTMIKDFTTMNMKNTLIFGLVLAATTFTALAQPALQKSQVATTEATTINTTETSGTSLREVAVRAEKDLKTKVLVGQQDADNRIQVNFGADKMDYGQLLTQLKINEYTAYKSKDYIQIIPMRDARNLAIPIVETGKTYYEDEVVTDYLKTEKACSAQVLATVRPLVPKVSHLSVYEDARTLIIIDTYGNIQRIKAVINALEANLDAPIDCKNVKPPEKRPTKSPAK